jgi:hypothetical protein
MQSPPPKMAADTKIAGLFNLIIESPPVQDKASCKFVIDHLVKFYGYVNDNKSGHPWITETELVALGSSLKLLQAEEPHKRIDWMPKYGCAIMKSKAGCTSGVIALNLISLDLHQFNTRSELSSNGYNYINNASLTGYQVLHVGTCKVVDLKTHQDLFSSKLASAQTWTGDKCRATGGQQEHQRTPAFIHALYREVLGLQRQVTRDGWMDMGMHTGGQEQRPTAWPLVTSSLYQLMNNRKESFHLSIDKFFKKVMAYFGLYMCEGKIDQYERTVTSKPRSNTPNVHLDRAFCLLQSSSIVAAALSDEGVDHDMSHFLTLSKLIRDQIMGIASSQSIFFSKQYELPQSDADIVGTFDNFCFIIPAKYSPAIDGATSEAKVCMLTEQNLGWMRVLVGERLQDVDKWVKKSMMSTPKQDALFRMLVLKTVNDDNNDDKDDNNDNDEDNNDNNDNDNNDDDDNDNNNDDNDDDNNDDNNDKSMEKSMMSTPKYALFRMLVLKTFEGMMWNYMKNMPVMTEDELQMLTEIVDN